MPGRRICSDPRIYIVLLLSPPTSSFVPSHLPTLLPRYCQRIHNSHIYSNPRDEDGDDDDAIDADTLGVWSEEDTEWKTDMEWDENEEDPNDLDPSLEYWDKFETDEDGVELGWDPLKGSTNPFDGRTIVTPVESYMVAEETKDDKLIESYFSLDDPENAFNEEVKELKKEMKIIDSYIDPWLNMEVPRNVAEWHGYHEQTEFPKKDFMNNRFTKPEDKTDFSKFTPFEARTKAVEMARSNNNEWLPEGMSEAYHSKKTAGFHRLNLLVGSFKKGECDPTIVEKIQPCLKVLGSAVELLSIQETVFRFKYYGPMKNKRGIEAWTMTMIHDCGVDCTGVVFETGRRKRDERD